MSLPIPKALTNRWQARQQERAERNGVVNEDGQNSAKTSSEDGALSPGEKPTTQGVDSTLNTKTRKNAIIVACFLYLLSFIFLILTLIGNINDKSVIRETYIFKLDLTNIIPASAGNSLVLVNSLARSIGLHDFYQVGLWNFCEGYNDEGITSCSNPVSLYWFNPVDIFVNELLAGATIALPAEVTNILKLIRIASHIMFGFFFTGLFMNFANIFLSPLVLYTRWSSIWLAIWTFVAAFLTTAAAIIGTVLGVVVRNVVTSQPNLNIGASIGNQMFAFMWIGAATSVLGWMIHCGLSACCCCCCNSRKSGKSRRNGDANAYKGGANEKSGKSGSSKLPNFRRRGNAEVV